MRRRTANRIRHLMDDCIPPVIRDSRWFMRPFFKIWFRNTNIDSVMNFKDTALQMSEAEFAGVYRSLRIRSNDRACDTNEASIRRILNLIDNRTDSLLDVGCGRGYLLNQVGLRFPHLRRTGIDLLDHVQMKGASYVRGSAEALPFASGSFDSVSCLHTIEHVRHLPQTIAELKRVARRHVIIATPCQRFYRYTLDLHLHFFPTEVSLTGLIDLERFECSRIDGDWLYVGYLAPAQLAAGEPQHRLGNNLEDHS